MPFSRIRAPSATRASGIATPSSVAAPATADGARATTARIRPRTMVPTPLNQPIIVMPVFIPSSHAFTSQYYGRNCTRTKAKACDEACRGGGSTVHAPDLPPAIPRMLPMLRSVIGRVDHRSGIGLDIDQVVVDGLHPRGVLHCHVDGVALFLIGDGAPDIGGGIGDGDVQGRHRRPGLCLQR